MTKKLCRHYYSRLLKGNRQNCPKTCPFNHPLHVELKHTKEYNRQLGHCYCGAELKTIMCKKRSNETQPLFFVVCGKTSRSIYRCQKG